MLGKTVDNKITDLFADNNNNEGITKAMMPTKPVATIAKVEQLLQSVNIVYDSKKLHKYVLSLKIRAVSNNINNNNNHNNNTNNNYNNYFIRIIVSL